MSTRNRVKVNITLGRSTIWGYITREQLRTWKDVRRDIVIDLYKPSSDVAFSEERFYQINGNKIDFVEELA